MASDVTRRRELEETLRQSQKMEAIGQLAGGVAHDFNNMLTAILSAAEEVRELSVSDDARELCGLIVSASEQAAALTHKLLSFSRKGKARAEPVEVHDVVRETVAFLSRSIDRNVTIVMELEASTSRITGDAAQLQGALLNLGINARDAMPSGGLLSFATTVCELDEVACATLPFELEPGAHLRLSVRDTGSGIPPEILGRIFEPFFTSKEVGKGTGLGLAAVYGAVVEHRGAVTVYSEVGGGAVFHLYFPLAEAPAASAHPVTHLPRGSGLVLVIDDEPLVRAVVTQLLQSLGYSVVTAADGVEGVTIFEERHAELTAVLCDLVMPRMSGAEALRLMRAKAPGVPMILSSGFPRDERAGPVEARADLFLAKPFHRTELARALAELTGNAVRT